MNNHVLPYVYKLTHKQTGQIYYGSRWKNVVSAEADLGVYYFTSSKYVKPIFHEFTHEIVAVFFAASYAYQFEQSMIYSMWGSELLLNRKYHIGQHKLWIGPVNHSTLTKQKMSNSRRGVPKTDQCRANMKLGKTGKHPRPDVAARNKLRTGLWSSPVKGRPQSRIACCHCGKVGSIANINRWHLDNCKLRAQQLEPSEQSSSIASN